VTDGISADCPSAGAAVRRWRIWLQPLARVEFHGRSQCKGCGKQVASRTRACEHCGFAPAHKRVHAIVFLAVVGIVTVLTQLQQETRRFPVAPQIKLETGQNAQATQQEDGRTPLHSAAERGDVRQATLLIAHGADVNARSTRILEAGATPLHLAKSLDIVALLMKNGAHIDERDQYGETPLMRAIERSDFPLTEYLLKLGASALTKNNDGDTTLLLVMRDPSDVKNHAVVQLIAKQMLKHGVSINAKDKKSMTALHYAAGEMSAEQIELLLSLGADMDATDIDGNTPLRYALLNENVDAVRILIAHGTNLDIKNLKGETPFTLACSVVKPTGHTAAIARLLAKAGRPCTSESTFAESQVAPQPSSDDASEMQESQGDPADSHAATLGSHAGATGATADDTETATIPTPEAVTPQPTANFEPGQTERRNYELWIASLTGAYQEGALFWTSQRSLKTPGSCFDPNHQSLGDFTAGCLEAQWASRDIALAP